MKNQKLCALEIREIDLETLVLLFRQRVGSRNARTAENNTIIFPSNDVYDYTYFS